MSGEQAATTVRAPSPSGAEAASRRRADLQRALGAGFDVKDLIGQGGFGEVWAATDVKLKRDVAVKVLREDLVASPSLLERFRREAEAAAKLRHPNIVPIYQVGEAEGLVYFVMPLIKGESLRGVLEREGRVEVAEAVRILTEAASALHEAHEAGIVHRDIKPDNILLEGPKRRVLLMDFGIAKSLEPQDGGLTGTGMVIGTPQYMSPEQASGEKQIDARSDLYSLGVVAYQMLAGRLPFEAESAQGMIVAHITAAPNPIEKVRTGVPEELAAAVMRALAKKPADRFASAAEFADAARPPVPVSEESPIRWVAKRLRRAARVARWQAYAAALVLLVAYLIGFQPDAFRRARSYWFAGQAGTDSAPIHFSQPNSFGMQLFLLEDSLLGVQVTGGGFALNSFDGARWRRTQSPPGGFNYVVAALSSGDSVLLVEGVPRPGNPEWGASAVWVLRHGALRLADSVGFWANAAWTDGTTLALAGGRSVGIRERGRWRMQPLSHHLTGMFGSRLERLRGIARSWQPDGADSILSYRGLAWQGADPRGSRDRRWYLVAGEESPSGSSVVVGTECRGAIDTWGSPEEGLPGCRPLVIVEDSVGAGWRRMDDGLPPSFIPHGVVTVSGDEFLVSGVHSGSTWTPWMGDYVAAGPEPPESAPLFELRHGRASPVAALLGSRIRGLVLLKGDPYALLSNGTLWTRRQGVWGYLTEVPGAHLEYYGIVSTRSRNWEAGVSDGTLMGRAASDSADWDAVYPFADSAHAGKAVLLQGGIYFLADNGRLFVYDCPLVLHNDRCRPRELPPPGHAALVDIARLPPDTLLAVGRDGFVATTLPGTSHWAVSSSRGLAGIDFVRVSVDSKGVAVALASESVWRRRIDGVWERWAELPAWLRPARLIAAGSRGSVAVVGERGQLGLLRDSQSPSFELLRQCGQGETTALAFVDDRRLALTSASENPTEAGTLTVTLLERGSERTESAHGRCQRVPLPRGVSLFGLKGSDGGLVAWGSGGFRGWWPVERLPFASTTEQPN